MTFVFDPMTVPALPVRGTQSLFPTRRVFCIGHNYQEHAEEMGVDTKTEPPCLFTKPVDAVVPGGGDIPYPSMTENLHHEAEMVLAIGKGGRDIGEEDAMDHVFGYAVGVDLTRRDLQRQYQKTANPWDMSKGFDNSAPCGAVAPVAVFGHPKDVAITLSVNGELRQSGNTRDLIWTCPRIIAHVSRFVTLCPGDLIFTGTPPGVGPLVRGDEVQAEIESVGTLSFRIV